MGCSSATNVYELNKSDGKKMENPKLYYFDIYFRAEPHRMLMSHAKVKYENVAIDKAV